jgi:uncharacterized Zn finger protein (UPF0148 family)
LKFFLRIKKLIYFPNYYQVYKLPIEYFKTMSSPNQNQCPICLDEIDFTTVSNRVTTECGHTFHCNCLMQNCAHNGFGCPYCRKVMATVPEDEEEEDEEEEEDVEEEEGPFTDDVLRGFRFFFNNLNNEEHLEEDIAEEDAVEEVEAKPTAAQIAENLVAQGITMEHLVKILLLDHDEYDVEEEEYGRVDDDVWEKMRIFISNYQPLTQQPVVVEETPAVPSIEAEPKTPVAASRRREFMMHV